MCNDYEAHVSAADYRKALAAAELAASAGEAAPCLLAGRRH